MPAESRDQEHQFENPEATKLENETISNATARKQMDRVAEELARKSSETEKQFDADRPIFTK
jgi:hypothetical protein